MLHTISIVVSSIFVLASGAFALETRFNGTLETFGAAYTRHIVGTEDLYGELLVRPKLTLIPTEQLLLVVSADLRRDSAGYTQGILHGVPDKEPRRATLGLREAYLEYVSSSVRLRVGNQVFDWSVTDTVSPADNLAPRDWTDIIRWERRALPAADVRIGTDSYLEATAIPFFMPSRLPPANSRWERTLDSGVSYGSPEYPMSDNPQLAVRAGTTWNSIDLGASLYHGFSFSPFWKPELSSAGVTLHPYYVREQVYALSAAKEIEGFNARFETGLFDQQGADDFMQFVFGLDREFGNVFRPSDSFYTLLQYSDEVVFKKENPYGVNAYDLRRILTKSIIGKFRYSFDDSKEWSLKLEGSYNFEHHDSYLQLAIAWKRGSLETELGGDLFYGKKDTFFGGYGLNERMYCKMNLLF
jgi:hypothetical protein